MIFLLIHLLLCSIQDTNYLNISLKPNERRNVELKGILLVFINSYQYSSDDVIFYHNKNGKISEYKPSDHLAFREGSLEIFSKKGVTFQSWILPSNSCPTNNYVVDPSQMTTLQIFFDSTPQFCIFTHLNFPFTALTFESNYNMTSNVMIRQSNWIPIQQRKTYSVNQPFIFFGKSNGNSLGYASIVYTAGNGKCNIAQIKEDDKKNPDIEINCQDYLRKFNMWLWGFIIIVAFAIIIYVLNHFRIINLYQYWNPPRISGNTFTNRVEEHLVIEESLENNQVDDTPNNETNTQQQSPHDAL